MEKKKKKVETMQPAITKLIQLLEKSSSYNVIKNMIQLIQFLKAFLEPDTTDFAKS